MSAREYLSRSNPCGFDGCGIPSWRSCRVCDLPVCEDHRHGAGHWVRCLKCSEDQLAEVMRAWRDQEREERELEERLRSMGLICPTCGQRKPTRPGRKSACQCAPAKA